jgi:hypothetical protein
MIYTIQMQAFNAAAEKFVQIFEAAGRSATQEGAEAYIAMMKLAPDRIRSLFMMGGQRDGLIPMAVTRPPAGQSYWDWVYSPADARQRLLACTTQPSIDMARQLLKDACKAAGVSMAPYSVPPATPVQVASPEYHSRLLEILADLEQRLAVATDAEQALYLHARLAGFLAEQGRPVPDLQTAAPMVPIHAVNLAALQTRVAARLAREDAETERELDMCEARIEVETAISRFGQDSDQARMAMAKAIQYLPADLKAGVDAKARELGLMPPASGYTVDGEPVFTVDALAKHFGMDPEEVMQNAGDCSMTVDAASIHRPQ